MRIDKRQPPRILLVDDEPVNLRVLKQVLQTADYRLSFARSGKDALKLVKQEDIDLILLDVMMPDMTGLEVCQQLKSQASTASIPVIFVTALKDSIDEEKGFEAGAVDYIVKPIVPAIVLARVKTHLSLIKADELLNTHIDLIHRLGHAAEYKDNETGMHVQRMSRYAKIIALAYGFCEESADDLMMAAPMHDIGKIGIPDKILLKPGKLTADEYEIMKTHAQIGGEILSNPSSHLIKLAHSVAMTHHEKWDGTGYPNGLAGEAIPIEGRIIALVDVFDALTSERPYKKAWPIKGAMDFITEQSGKHFDPGLVPLLHQELPKLLEIRSQFAER